MTNLALVKTDYFNNNQIDIYTNKNKEFYMTARQLAKALGYATKNGIEKLIERNPKLKNEEFSTTVKMSVVEGTRTVSREMRIFTEEGIYKVAFKAETDIAEDFQDWVVRVIKQIRESNNIKPEEMLKGNQNINTDNNTLQQVLSKLNSLEERFNGLQQERTQNIQTISTLEKVIKLEKRQIHINPITMKRSRIYEELKTVLFHNEFNNPDTAEAYNMALEILKSTYIKDIFDSVNFIRNKKFNKEYNSLEWALAVLGVGYTILHSGNSNIYENMASNNILFHKNVDQQFCDEYEDLYIMAEKQSYLHDNIISKLPQTAELNGKTLKLSYRRMLDINEKAVFILLNPTHMTIDSKITLNEYLIMLDMSMKKISDTIKK